MWLNHKIMKTDILIAGSGCSGLYFALNCKRDKNIIILTKADAKSSDSFLAQGGMCMLRDEDDFEAYLEDTMKAGHYENDPVSVAIMIHSSRQVVTDLLAMGTDFQRTENGELVFTKEGAHSEKRILYHRDETGKEITSRLLAEAQKRSNIKILEYSTLIDLIEEKNVCYGGVVSDPEGSIYKVLADTVVLATGGVGGVYEQSTNFPHLTGDGVALAIRHGVRLRDIQYVQIHPTTLYTPDPKERSFLISESVRGEGAKLYDKRGNRFVNELLPRDLLTEKILEQMEKDHTDHVWEDLRMIPQRELEEHFTNIIEHCRQMGYDVFKECIPVVPAQHYIMGGIRVDHQSRTSMQRLFAVGETACNGVHGKNRLASNSLLESLVFAKRAAQAAGELTPLTDRQKTIIAEKVNLNCYNDLNGFAEENIRLVRNAVMQKPGKESSEKVFHRPQLFIGEELYV